MTLSKGATSWVHHKACVGPLFGQGVLHFPPKNVLSSVVTLPSCMLDYCAQMHSKSNLQAVKLSIPPTCTIATKINYGCVSKLGLNDDCNKISLEVVMRNILDETDEEHTRQSASQCSTRDTVFLICVSRLECCAFQPLEICYTNTPSLQS